MVAGGSPGPLSDIRSEDHFTPRLRDVVTTPERLRHYVTLGLWDDTTLTGRLAVHSTVRPDATAIVDEANGVRATFAQLERDSARVANFLRDAAIKAGDVVALQLPNWYTSAVVALGALRAGAVVNPMLPAYRERELSHMLRIGRTKVIFTPRMYRRFDHEPLIESLRRDLPSLSQHVVLAPELDSFETQFAPYGDRFEEDGPDPAAVCELIFTSGTEAEPKAIMHTERTLNASSRATWNSLGMTSADVIWMPAPIGHSTGFNHGLRLAVFHGLTLVLQDRWDPVEAARLIEREGCTHTLLSTTFLRDLTEVASRGEYDLSSLRLFTCGGAPIPPELVEAAQGQGIGCLRLYGATEFLVATCNRPGAPGDKLSATEGVPFDSVEVEIRNVEGRSVVGEAGEVFVRSPSGCVGFCDDPARTHAVFAPDGWIQSGDLGVIDEDGYLTVVGRQKDIIIRGGLNITPREVEDVLVRISGVRDAVVVGLPDPRLGEILCACIVPQPKAEITLEGVVSELKKAGVATFKLPQRLELMDELPTTAVGKVRRYLLISRIMGFAAQMPDLARPSQTPVSD